MCTHGDKEGARRLAVAYVWIKRGQGGWQWHMCEYVKEGGGKEAGSGICVNMWRRWQGGWLCEGGGKEAGSGIYVWICEGGGKEAGSGICEGGKEAGSGICVNMWRSEYVKEEARRLVVAYMKEARMAVAYVWIYEGGKGVGSGIRVNLGMWEARRLPLV